MLGGGQLGRMLLREAQDIDVHMSMLDPARHAPCSELANSFSQGDFADYDTVMEFGKGMDVITVEIEHVNTQALHELEQEGIAVYPQPSVLELIQDKGRQKEFYRDNGIPTADFRLIENASEIGDSMPIVQKLRTGGYDGRGVQVLRTAGDMEKAFDEPSVLEDLVDLEMEISVIAARNAGGDVSTFPAVEMEFNPEANLVEFLCAPARIDKATEEKARKLAAEVAEKMGIVGLLAVELFLNKDGELLVNECAPRPHNSGHHTIEGNYTSQYGQHLRAILGLPPGNTDLRCPAVMVNLLGDKDHTGPVIYEGIEKALALPGVYMHIYGKAETKPFRKMGHATVLADTLEEAISRARKVKELVRVISA